METLPSSLAAGRDIIARHLLVMPESPGIYRMLDEKGDALYIGKAGNIKKRVASYLNIAAMGTRLQRMVSQVASMEVTTTRSEAEALLLEANLVKKFTPRYNVLLKDDKSFPYIFISGDHDFPRIAKHRGPKTKKGKYFGPFVAAAAVDEAITTLQRAFLLRPCSDNVFKNRTRPCLQYQIKRCSAPCVDKIGKEEYARLAAQAQDFLSGRSRRIHDELVDEMQALALKMDYEKARVVRDRIKALSQVQNQRGEAAVGDADVIAFVRQRQHCCIELFSFRGGRNYGNRAFFPTGAGGMADAEIIADSIVQYYQSQPPPPLILTSQPLPQVALLEEALSLGRDYRIEIVYPLRGGKRGLVQLALTNAHQALARHLAMHEVQRDVLERLREQFGLEEIPERIEVYDNSHTGGAQAVGTMIVAGQKGLVKSEYRKFNIKREDIAPGDDYAMLREVLSRRFRNAHEEGATSPGLVLIDGGAGQVAAAAGVFEELGISHIAYAGIAKGEDRNAGRERFFLPGREPFSLPENDPLLHFLQRLRDEAHRFAIGAHRGRRGKTMRVSKLDEIPSIGPARKKALLTHFGSARAIGAASIDEIAKVEGIGRSVAEVIYGHFHGDGQ